MAKNLKRQCPGCGQSKSYRSDQVTCGCKGTNPNLAASVKSDSFDEAVKKLLLGSQVSLTDAANRLNVPPKTVEEAVQRLAKLGHNVTFAHGLVEIPKQQATGGHLVIPSSDFYDGEWFKFGFLSDTHLYSKYARLDVLNCLYDLYEREGIHTVFHAGNIIDGETHFNRYDLIGPSGLGPQADYFAKEYPKREGIVTKFITGDDHEGWFIQREGLNIGRFLQDSAEAVGRSDLQWIGHVEVDVHFQAKSGSSWVKIMHPGGGSAYATSYTEQKIVEAMQGGEKPQALLLGHYHKFSHGYPREVHTVQGGTTCDQTIFMRKNKLQAHVGGCIIKFHQADTGEFNRFSAEFIPFYDRGYFEDKNKYREW